MVFIPSPDHVRNEPSLRRLIKAVLMDWMRKIDRGDVPIHIAKLRGTMRLIPGKHFHLYPELFLQLSGETVFEFPEEKFRVGGGSLCIVPRGIPHYERVRPWRGPFYNLVFMYGGQDVSCHLADERPRGRPHGRIATNLHAAMGTPLRSTLDEACHLYHLHNDARSLGLKGLLLAHFTLLLKSLEGWSEPQAPEPFKISQARLMIMRQLPNPDLSVAWLARQLQCNVDYLSQLFRKTTGSPLLPYINKHRLLRAQDLLINSSLNIAEISQAAGFRDPSYFTRFFHQQTGQTPRAYRSNG